MYYNFKKIISRVFNDPISVVYLFWRKLSPIIPDNLFLHIEYWFKMGYWPDLKNPKTFNEKLQWLKLYNRKPEYTIMADKVRAKEWVAELIGEEYIIPTIGVWDNPEDIDFDSLPNQFVLKCNHNSGTGMFICKDKKTIDIESVKRELKKGMKENYYKQWREWPYKNITRKILAEKYMEEENSKEGLKDYKLLCFNGKVYCSFVCSDRFNDDGLKVTFFDKYWRRLPFERHYPSAKNDIKMPIQYNKMIELAEILSNKIPFVRTDFYEINGKLYFGEMTFFPGSGLEEFTPEKWDKKLGALIQLPNGGGVYN